ncbi:hypothetical protein M409DRAFT_59072 [Zasmidium cellare ATCC 36951]|uniref:Zn(2)-C6 fungal-type domain-containing protein n=1 Tax=Zasmidium cellare ATCC 36951 TaxID=1080233 RepID=A0A6A6C2M0_ZASCE|nr:uncharacterized protein M409DRAFT_59072 [Zasmidium cellare ATCC 36951]KAF2161354.1 hypothetical protein M409DRAFT_59072 [Zasmidium cellare ATCC 36951]
MEIISTTSSQRHLWQMTARNWTRATASVAISAQGAFFTPIKSPGRRKACRQCARSKLRCDLSRPRCGSCQDRSISCEFLGLSRSISSRAIDSASSSSTSTTTDQSFVHSIQSFATQRQRELTSSIPATIGCGSETTHVVHLTIRILRSWARQVAIYRLEQLPPMIHSVQLEHGTPWPLRNCCLLAAMWADSGDEGGELVSDCVLREIERLLTECFTVCKLRKAYVIGGCTISALPANHSAVWPRSQPCPSSISGCEADHECLGGENAACRNESMSSRGTEQSCAFVVGMVDSVGEATNIACIESTRMGMVATSRVPRALMPRTWSTPCAVRQTHLAGAQRASMGAALSSLAPGLGGRTLRAIGAIYRPSSGAS